MSSWIESDAALVTGAVIVFALPLTLLIPGFNIWDVVPKVRVTRYFVFSGCTSWFEMNIALLTLIAVFFCLYLEIRKRKLDEMVERVMTVSQATDVTLAVEEERQAVAVKACVELLDASSDHYENLMLLQDELRRRRHGNTQKPPAVEISSSEFT